MEYHTSRGRVDLVLKTSDYIYVMEFKLDGTAEEAMAQIDAKGYASAFAADGRKVVKVGVNFSSETRTIDRWIIWGEFQFRNKDYRQVDNIGINGFPLKIYYHC